MAAPGQPWLRPFVTREVFRLPDGTRLLWDARWHRKHAGRVPGGSTWWGAVANGLVDGVLFRRRSICFALGSFPLYATAVGTNPTTSRFFAGSIFFTTASFLQYMESRAPRPTFVRPAPQRARLVAAAPPPPHRLVAAGIQLIGRCGSTGPPERAVSSAGRVPRTPPIGVPTRSAPSASSSPAGWPGRGVRWAFAWRPSRISWWITALNLGGSVAFGISAVASYVTSSGQLLSVALTNLGTFVGAVCFLIGAVLLLRAHPGGAGHRAATRFRASTGPIRLPAHRSATTREPGVVASAVARRLAQSGDHGGERLASRNAEIAEAPTSRQARR